MGPAKVTQADAKMIWLYKTGPFSEGFCTPGTVTLALLEEATDAFTVLGVALNDAATIEAGEPASAANSEEPIMHVVTKNRVNMVCLL